MAPQGTHAGGRKLGRCQQILMGSHGSKFCKSKSAGIASGDVLPLPSVSFDAPNKWNSLPLSRSVIRRLQSKNHIEKWLDLGISALNSLGGFHTSRSGGLISNNKLNNHFHHIKHLRKDYDSVGPPPSGWCPQEAFRELQGSCGDYAGISGSLAVYREGGVSLPDVGSRGAVLASLSSGQASLYLDEHDSLLRSHDSRDAELAKLEFDRPYIDPVLKQSAVKYSGFVRELHQKGVIKYDYTHTADVGVFFVKKKDDSLRLIFDTRVANCHFINPDATDLTGPAGISDIPCDPPGWSFGQGDIKNAFYMFKTPVWLHQYFCLPPVRARDVGVKAIDGKAVAGHEIIYPQVQVLPMGWSWATYFCQSSVVSTLIKGGHVSSSELVRGNYPSPPLRDDRSHLIVYIDNFAHISSNNDIAVEHTKKSAELLNAQGLPVHDISWSNTEEAFLGTLLKSEGSVFNSSKRLWKIRGCIEHMLASPRLTGQQLEKLIGHITFAFLIRRELLSILSSAYAFISVNYYSRKWLWASVKRELSIVLALLPLANSKCFYPFDPVVYCSDACEYGHGTCRSEWDVETVKNVCSIRERWRFLDPDAIHARDHALQNELNSHLFDSCKERPFDEVPPHLCESQHWQVLTARKFNRQENILILEGRALMWALKRKLRDVDSIGKRHLFLVDNLALALSVEKGRSSAGVNNILRSWCANILASSVRAYVRWIPSENNPADRPSRLFEPKKHVVPKVAFSKICPTECSNTTCPGQSFSHRPKAESVVSSSSFLSALSDFDSDHAEENCSDSGNHHSQAQPSHSDRGKADNQRRGQPKTKSFRQPSNHCSFKWYQCASRIFDRACYTSALLSLFPGILKGDASIEDEVSDRHHFCRGDAPCLGFVSGRIPRLPIFLRAAKKRWGLPGGKRKVSHATSLHTTGSPGIEGLGSSRASPAEGASSLDMRSRHCRGAPVDAAAISSPGNLAHVHDVSQAHGTPRKYNRPVDPSHFTPGGRLPVLGVHSAASHIRETGQKPFVRPKHCTRPSRTGVDQRNTCSSMPAKTSSSDVCPSVKSICPSVQGSLCKSGNQLPGTRTLQSSPRGGVSRHSGKIPIAGASSIKGKVVDLEHDAPVRKTRIPGKAIGKADANSDGKMPIKSSQYRAVLQKELNRSIKLVSLSCQLVFLELFAGSGGLSQAVRNLGHAVISFEITSGPQFDLTNHNVIHTVLSWIKGGLVVGLWCGTPCTTWSRARRGGNGPGPLRNNDNLFGLPNPSPCDAEKIRVGNKTMYATSRLIACAIKLSIPVILENPATSMLWLAPPIKKLCERVSCYNHILDFCSFGTPWRKRTRFAIWNCLHLDLLLGHKCSSRKGMCDFSGNQHVRLEGCKDGKFLTHAAQSYPKKLCQLFARIIHHTIRSSQLDNIEKHIM